MKLQNPSNLTSPALGRINKYTVYYGTVVHTPSLGVLESYPSCAVVVDFTGIITDINYNCHNIQQYIHSYLSSKYSLLPHQIDLVDISSNPYSFFFPGFIDTHIHAPQFPNAGIFGNSTLLDWLDTYTFPLEASFKNLTKADVVYNRVVDQTLAHGTTTASYFATIHCDATKLLANICYSKGQRAMIGRVCMDDNSPDYYSETHEQMKLHTVDVCNHIEDLQKLEAKVNDQTKNSNNHMRYSVYPSPPYPRSPPQALDNQLKPLTSSFATCNNNEHSTTPNLNNNIGDTTPQSHHLIYPTITPRFAPSCTKQTLKWLGELRSKNDLHVQSHVSENIDEIKLVLELFPECDSYTDVYSSYNLLSSKSVLAHGVHLSLAEIDILRKTQAGISHCPISNSSLTSGETQVRKLLDKGIKVGLGTDMSGGFSPSILATARQALLVSRHLAMKNDNDDTLKLSVNEVLYLGTIGSAKCLNLENLVGDFQIGKKWEAQVINLQADGSQIDVFDWQLPKFLLKRDDYYKKHGRGWWNGGRHHGGKNHKHKNRYAGDNGKQYFHNIPFNSSFTGKVHSAPITRNCEDDTEILIIDDDPSSDSGMVDVDFIDIGDDLVLVENYLESLTDPQNNINLDNEEDRGDFAIDVDEALDNNYESDLHPQTHPNHIVTIDSHKKLLNDDGTFKDESDQRKFDDLIAKWLFNGDDRNTEKVFVNGRCVIDKTMFS